MYQPKKPMSNKLTQYKLKSNRKRDQAKQNADKKPYWGKKECRLYDIPTVATVFANARVRGRVLANHLKRLASQDHKVNVSVETTLQKYAHLWLYRHSMSDEMFSRHARDLGNTIYDLPCRWTGYETQESIKSNENRCQEHFYPRQWAGCQIMTFILDNDGITFSQLRRFFDIFRQVHYTTSSENRKLMPLQESSTFTDWEEAYEKMCSPLVQVEDRGPILSLEDF